MTELAVKLGEAEAGTSIEAWEAPPRKTPSSAAPVLAIDGFEGPLDWLLEMARAQQLDLSKLSILQLVDAFLAALDAALAGEQGSRADLARWGDWLVMATTLALLRSRLLLPPDAPAPQAAQDEAAALQRLLLDRAFMRDAADWLDRRPQLGRDVFARGGAGAAARGARSGDSTELLRACLVTLEVPELSETYQLHRPPFWRVSDAVARITRLLEGRTGGGALGSFLPAVDGEGAERGLRCRAAVASTFLAGLELARAGTLGLEQPMPWQDIHIQALA